MGKTVKKGKMRNGIRKVGNRYEAFADLGSDPVTGRRRRESETKDTRHEAAEWKKRTEAAAVDGRVIDGRMQLSEYLDTWLDISERERADSTRRNLEGIIRKHIKPSAIGRLRVRDLRRYHLVDFISKFPSEGSVRHKVEALLRSAMAEAEDLDLVARNPVRRSRGRKQVRGRHGKTLWWTVAESALLLDAVDRARPIMPSRGREFGFSGMPAFVYVALASGLRLGELLGLQWSDVNFETATLLVRHQLKNPPLRLTTTLKAHRDQIEVDVDAETVVLLRSWRNAQREERLRAGSGWLAEHALDGEVQPNEFVFTTTEGAPLRPDVIRAWFARLVQDAKLPWRKIHGLRHTHAFVLLNSGWPLEKVSRRLGHATTGVTDSYYGHIVRAGRPGAAALSVSEVIATARRLGGSWVGATGSEDPSAT